MVASTALPPSRNARALGIKTEYVRGQKNEADVLPMRIAVMGQADFATAPGVDSAKRQVSSAEEVGNLYGFGSPLYLMCRSLFPSSGDGVGDIPVWVYPLTVSGGAQATDVTGIVPSGTGTKTQVYYAKVNNVLSNQIVSVSGETVATFVAKAVAAINAVYGMPVTASDGTTSIDFEARWEGDTGNNVYIEMVSPDDAEFTFTNDPLTLSNGAGTVAVDAAGEGLNLIGEAWDTIIVSAFDYDDSTTLDAFNDYGEGRRLPETMKPLVVVTGTNVASVTTLAAVTDARSADRTNIIFPNPGSNDLPFVIAADAVRRVAAMANTIPSHDYGRLKLSRLTPALDSAQWNSSQRETAFDSGLSSIVVSDSVVRPSDVITCYHPGGEEPAAYAYMVDIVKLMNVIHNFNGVFEGDDWASGPALVPDDQTVDPSTGAKKPKDALSAMAVIYANLAKAAIISDPDYAISNSTATISGSNPKRLDIIAKFLLSGNANVIPITLQWGFYYGG